VPGQVQVLVYGAELVERELIGVGERAADMMPFWPGVEAKLESIEREQFASYGARGPSGPWPENTPEWNWKKFQRGDSLERMKATEVMFEALTGEGFGMGAIRLKTPETLRFGADMTQFAVWQGGYDGKGTGQRFPIDLTEADEVELAADIMNYIVGTASVNTGYTLDARGRKRIPKGQPGGGRFA
jgi:hypothetical protein